MNNILMLTIKTQLREGETAIREFNIEIDKKIYITYCSFLKGNGDTEYDFFEQLLDDDMDLGVFSYDLSNWIYIEPFIVNDEIKIRQRDLSEGADIYILFKEVHEFDGDEVDCHCEYIGMLNLNKLGIENCYK